MTLYDPSLAGPKRSISDLGCYCNNDEQGPFFLPSIPTVTSVKIQTFGVISFGVDTICKICSQLHKSAVT